MIIGKDDNGQYICKVENQVFTIQSKESYIAMKKEIEAIKEPSEKELIELGKQHHPYYMKELGLLNVDNNLKEIDEFEVKLIEEVVMK